MKKPKKFTDMSDSYIAESKPYISVIIVNYNLAQEIENCLNSLIPILNSSGKINYEVIIVDNDSPDKSLQEVEKKFKQNNIRFYYLEENTGFGKGNNFGFSKASGEYICFLNPDTIVKHDIFLHIIALFESDKSIGIIGPKQQVRSPFFDFSAGFSPNIFFELFNLFGVGVFLEGFIISLLTGLKKDHKIKVNWILGAAIFIRSDLFRKVNGFDRDYFMFFEEVDLCNKVLKQNLRILYCPQFEIYHIGSVSGKKDYKLYTIRTYSSKRIFVNKHFHSITKMLMISLLYLQLFSQIIIWAILFPLNTQKSKQKINAFTYLIKNKMNYEHRD
jgi:GT2 family glycosyltransferase